MPLTAGTPFGPYEVIAALGAGGMGEVYRARDLRLERTVALEVLPEIFTSDPERLDAEGNPSAVSNSPTLTARVRASVRRRGV